MSKKSSTFAAAFGKSSWFDNIEPKTTPSIGAPENPLVFGESGAPEHFNEAGAVRRKTQSVCEGREREGEVGEWLKPPVC